MLGICNVKYFRIFAHAQAVSFLKKKTGFFFFLFLKQVFLKLTIFYFKKQRHSDKSNHIFWKCIKNNGSVDLNTFLNFVDVSSYLKLKGCAVSFELQMSQTLSTPFWKALTKFHQGKSKLQSSKRLGNVYMPSNSSTIFTLQVV